MNDASWSDDEFRSFLSSLRSSGPFSDGPDDADRDRFVRQARHRLAPEVQRRLLADIGAMTDAAGIAHAALDVLEDEMWGKRGRWLMVTSDPWRQLTDLVTCEIRASYRASARRGSDARTIRAIAKATASDELGPPRPPAAPHDTEADGTGDEAGPRGS